MRELLLKMGGWRAVPAPRQGRGNLLRVGWELSGHRLHRAAGTLRHGNSGFPLLIGSFGASAVLAFGAIRSPLAQPRNLVGGHFLSALVGVSCYFLFPGTLWLASCLAVATAIALMHVTKTLHPPGGATALIAVTGGEAIHQLGYLYAFVPCLLGALIMLAIALIVNNIPKAQRYPQFWW